MAAEPPDDDESRAAAAVLDALFNDTSSESDFEDFAPAEVEALMMLTVGARIDSSEDDMGENREGKEDQPRMSLIRTLAKLLLMAWTRTGEYIRSLRSPVFTGAIQISILLYLLYWTIF